jgi:ABC-2 type transport system ATP-binding protein
MSDRGRKSKKSDAKSKGSAQAPALLVTGLSFSYGAVSALDDVSFDVLPGRFTGLLGPNGAGKTTLFALITRLLSQERGQIEIAGRDLAQFGSAALAPLGIVFQQPTLDLDLTVRQNLAYFASLHGLSGAARTRAIERELERMEMSGRAGERVRVLNGGHRRRVEIARALLHDPSVLILDEPTVGLDVPSRAAIVAHVHALAQERGLGVLWATHLIDEIEARDDIVLLHRGRIVERGPVADVVKRTGAKDISEAFDGLTRAGAA